MNRFTVVSTPLQGLNVIERHPIGDARGNLTRLFCSHELAAAGWSYVIAQINYTCTESRGTVRGMHFQRPPQAEAKLVTCLRGCIWDVAVDLRANSPTFLKWHAEELSAENHRALLIPPGFAHGFQTLEDACELLYLHSAPYAPTCEAGLNANDEALAIRWPLSITEISKRDMQHPLLESEFVGMTL